MGFVTFSGVVKERYSTTWRLWFEACVHEKVAGSSIFWICIATRSTPPSWAPSSSAAKGIESCAMAGVGSPAMA